MDCESRSIWSIRYVFWLPFCYNLCSVATNGVASTMGAIYTPIFVVVKHVAKPAPLLKGRFAAEDTRIVLLVFHFLPNRLAFTFSQPRHSRSACSVSALAESCRVLRQVHNPSLNR